MLRPLSPLLGAAAVVLALAGCATDSARRLPAARTSSTVARPSATAARPPASRPAWQARRVVPDAVPVPGGRRHTVKPGETGIAIARAYGADWSKVATANNLKPPYVLEVGDTLLLPSASQIATQTAAMSIEDRARAFRLDIDDIITGGEPATARPTPRRPPARPDRAPAQTPPPAPLPVLAGDAPRFAWPVEGRIVSAFGAKPGGRFNDGVNLKASAGAPVRAAAGGVIAYAGDAIPGFGNLVLIKHPGNYVTAYGHNEALLVARGKRIARGDIIARAGATGAVTEPQVHFEIRRGRTPVDPARLIGGR